jgi:hypothetical protein
MADTPSGPPPIDSLKTGDLLFPRPKDGWVPYLRAAANQEAGYGEEEKEWLALRRQIASGEGTIPAEAREKIAKMSYDEFRARYGGGGDPALFGVHFYTGHVAIFDSGSVIEALWGDIDKVIRRPYADWATEHADKLVWQSRLKDRSADELLKFCDVAKAQVGIPYDFLDFDLLDASGFYCSKLVWFAVWTALAFAMDDNEDAIRLFWYSPKQLLHSRHLTAIQFPANY